MSQERVLPADVFDTLELAAYAYGGVGAGSDYQYSEDGELPLCVFGLACEAGGSSFVGPVPDALGMAGISRGTNDEAVRAINIRKGLSPHRLNSRVDFLTEWVPELNVVRGE